MTVLARTSQAVRGLHTAQRLGACAQAGLSVTRVAVLQWGVTQRTGPLGSCGTVILRHDFRMAMAGDECAED